MRAIEILEQEHRVIEQVLACLDRMAEQAGQGRGLDPESAHDAVGFFRNFADRCHHGKEEDRLFPTLEARGFSPDAGPTAVMRQEHRQGRRLVAAIEASIDGAAAGHPDAVAEFVRAARLYGAMLRAHIQKEDHCLFPMVAQALGRADLEALAESFERVEREEIGADEHARWLRTADKLAARFGVGPVPGSHPGCCGNHPAA